MCDDDDGGAFYMYGWPETLVGLAWGNAASLSAANCYYSLTATAYMSRGAG